MKATNISNETTKPACYECYDDCAPFACSAFGWNTPTHMVTGAIAYRTLEGESPRTVSVIQTLLEKHPWDADRWRDNVEKLPESQRGEMLFMLAARWADDIRPQAKLQREVRWHYINFPFKPRGEPEEIKPLLPDRDNILVGRLSKISTELLSKFSRVGLRELDQRLPEAWAKESYEVAVKIAYENENLREPRKDRLGIAARYRTRTSYPVGIRRELSSLPIGELFSWLPDGRAAETSER